VVRTRVGYTGGKKKNPTYHDLGDHTETVQVEFDPAVTSYENLLNIFWAQHNPTLPFWRRQYMAAVWYHDSKQEEVIYKTRDEIQAKRGKEVKTQILPAVKFYDAEDYHQKYSLGRYRDDVVKALHLENDDDFIASHAAARLNGFLGGNGSCEDLEREIDSFGLPHDLRAKILEVVWSKNGQHGTCPYTGKK